MLNRNALMLRYKDPAIRWLNEVDPSPQGQEITLADANGERTVYLVDDRLGESPRALERWLKVHYAALFERELEAWYTDPMLWPEDRTLARFRDWFDVELHTVLIDLGTEALREEDG